MDTKNIFILQSIIFITFLLRYGHTELPEIPYTSVENICKKCVCLSANDTNGLHYILSCSTKNFKHILADWPQEFGNNHTGQEINAIFSGNSISLLQQIPHTNVILSFSCRHCNIKEIQPLAFIDVPNILRLDLSWNQLISDVLRPDIFRGPYNVRSYEPINLEDLNLSHNQIHTLDKRLFEHTPYLKRLNLAYNKFDLIDITTLQAINSITKLKYLDLSYNELENLPDSIFKHLFDLEELLLQGNFFKIIPNCITTSLKSSLIKLNFGDNQIKKIHKNNFNGLKQLKQLNISGMNQLESIEIGSFSTLENLEILSCNNNPLLINIDFENLKVAENLKEIDISNCALKTLDMEVDINQLKNNLSSSLSLSLTLPSSSPLSTSSSSSSAESSSASSTTTIKKLWPKLHTLKIFNNPWNCDCMLIKILEQFTSQMIHVVDKARCTTPYDLAGSLIYNLNGENICNIPIPRKLKIPIHDSPTYLKSQKSIVLSIITVATVIAFGLIVGFSAIMLRKKLRKNEFGFITPIHYTTVRNSINSVE